MVTEKQIKDWYNQRYHKKKENAWRPAVAYPIFLNYLNITPGGKLLDIGCGTGYLLNTAARRGLETYGIDISEEGVEIAKKVSPASQIAVGKGEELKFPDKFFDYVTCLGALEHFLDIGRGIKEIARVGKDNALFCIVVPNIDFLLWKISGKQGTEQQDINENLLSLEGWKNIFIENGLDVLKIYQDKWFMRKTNIFSSANPLGIIKRMIYKAAWIFLPLKYTYQFVFILKKKYLIMLTGVDSKSSPKRHFLKLR